MKFVGIRRVFSTENEEQYITIGAFWDEMNGIKNIENTAFPCYSIED